MAVVLITGNGDDEDLVVGGLEEVEWVTEPCKQNEENYLRDGDNNRIPKCK